MSPNIFSVSKTSKSAGRDTSSMATESTYMCDSLTSEYSFATRVTTSRHRREQSSTLALSTEVTLQRREGASLKNTRAKRSISPLLERMGVKAERVAAGAFGFRGGAGRKKRPKQAPYNNIRSL